MIINIRARHKSLGVSFKDDRPLLIARQSDQGKAMIYKNCYNLFAIRLISQTFLQRFSSQICHVFGIQFQQQVVAVVIDGV